ncbi:MAG: MarR family transcriptional regulator [Rhodospirillaceae bacterium]|nr:MarR family transcriptional regulator [Rhodospirillaceae bacterium]
MIKLDDSIGFLINRAAFTMKRALDHKLAAYDLTAPQWAILTQLWEKNGQPLIAIGKNLYFDKATMSGIIDR